MSFTDDGVGLLPARVRRPACLGLQIVDALAEQLRARLEVTVDGGTRYVLSLEPAGRP